MKPRQILILGGGFAGLWAAAGVVRKLDQEGIGPEEVEVTLVNRDAFHSIRVRNYEADLTSVRVPLDEILEPIGVRRVEGDVVEIRSTEREVNVVGTDAGGPRTLTYDRMVFALGSQLVRPDLPGLVEHGFDVDTYEAAARLGAHLRSLPGRPATPGQFTVLVVGAGLTGVEVATEMPGRLRTILEGARESRPGRVILADHAPRVGSDMGEDARPVIEEALRELGIETRVGVSLVSIDGDRATLSTGEVIPAATLIWCAGMRANPLARLFAVGLDPLGRLPVDMFLKVDGLPDVFAAGDVARSLVDETHASVMSCQHSRPMGRYAGHNAAADLLGLPKLPLRIEWYATILDLGPWGAVYTKGWDRAVFATGEEAKRTKQIINGQRIYPPLTGDRRAILDAAAPIIQAAPRSVGWVSGA
jgi:NADH:ubiquinone reductase (H+-translocating)